MLLVYSQGGRGLPHDEACVLVAPGVCGKLKVGDEIIALEEQVDKASGVLLGDGTNVVHCTVMRLYCRFHAISALLKPWYRMTPRPPAGGNPKVRKPSTGFLRG